MKWFEQQRELRRVKRDVPIEQHVKKRDFGDGPDPVAPNLTMQSTPSFSFQSEFSDGLADDIWDGIFAEMKGESSTESQKRKRQNSFASSFSDPMFRCGICLLSRESLTTVFQVTVVFERRWKKRCGYECETSLGKGLHR